MPAKRDMTWFSFLSLQSQVIPPLDLLEHIDFIKCEEAINSIKVGMQWHCCRCWRTFS